MKASIEIKGMSCGHCVQAVTQALKSVEGVKFAEVDLAENKAEVEYDESVVSLEALHSAIENVGFDVV
ncbi:copper ion binding protein [Filifactor villosus]|uniref:Copper chaperone CopZ n=1 Tax=Filifactor villosus TaxID=29374 RepID=A0ABV9QKH2_9FIRM